jgi:Divergent InlB B-repeat domain
MSPLGRRRLVRVLPVVLLAVIFAVGPGSASGAGTLGHATPSAVASGATLAAPAAPSPSPSPPAPPPVSSAPPPGIGTPSGPTVASGPGSFYTTQALPNPSFANETCVAGACYNTSNDVTVNATSNGVLAVAYTSLTDQSPCASLRPYSVSNIAFLTSRNWGATWSPVQYLGNPACTGKNAGYADAWEPTLTSLSNGTLVMAYVEYNLSAGALPPLTQYTWPPTESRLVVTESYDNGTVWTPPQVLNISNPPSAPPGLQFTPAHPSITAFGETVYLTWMSLTTLDSAGAIAYITSSDGGNVWSPTIPVSTGPFAYYSMNPSIMVDPAGRVYIAYASNITFNYGFFDLNNFVFYDFFNGVYLGNIWVASSYTNGTVFNYTEVAQDIFVGSPAWDPSVNPASFGPFQTPAPVLGYSEATDTVYVAFTAPSVTNATVNFYGDVFCETSTPACLAGSVYFYAGASNGTSFFTQGNTATLPFNPGAVDPATGAANATDSVTSLALAVQPGGEVDLEAGFYNGTMCSGSTCGAESEVVFSTTDGGLTFSSAATVTSPAYTPDAYGWNGETGAAIFVNGSTQFFWTSDSCPTWLSLPCGAYPYSAGPVAQVEDSTFYNATGTTLTFVAVGLPSTVNWTVTVMGNERGGNGTTSLSVSGVPTAQPAFYTVPDVNLTDYHYVVQVLTLSPPSPVTPTGPTTVTVRYSEYVPVTEGFTVPPMPLQSCEEIFDSLHCPTFYPDCEYNDGTDVACYSQYFTSGTPGGTEWVLINQPVTIGVSPIPFTPPTSWPCPVSLYGGSGFYWICDVGVYNLTLLGWAGVGPGSSSSSSSTITFTPEGPVTETASFVITGLCGGEIEYMGSTVYYTFGEGCSNYTGSITLDEQGLPAGTAWGATFANATGQQASFLGATAPYSVTNSSAPVGFNYVEPWNVPTSNASEVYAAALESSSLVLVPTSAPLVANYSLKSIGSLDVPVQISVHGLPNGLSANLTLNDTTTGTGPVSLSVPRSGFNGVFPGGDYVVNVSPILTTNGVRYTPSVVYADVGLMGDGNQSGVAPLPVLFGGPVSLTVVYTASYWVSLSAGIGGSVTPGSQWVDKGAALTLRATPNSGYIFVSWTGSGLGATTVGQSTLEQVVITPGGPVVELATFAPRGAPTWKVNVVPTGLPAGQVYSVTLGSSTYTGSGTLVLRGIATGTYPISFPNVTTAGSALTRYVETSLSATSGLSGDMLTVGQNLSVEPSFTTQYYVTTAVTGSGTISLGPGNFWEPANSTLTVTATPAAGAVLIGWSGSFDGGPTTSLSNETQLQVVLTGSAFLIATFGPAPFSAAKTYDYTLVESGLPGGVDWQVVIDGTSGAAGATSTLIVTSLNGTYTLSVPTVYVTSGVRYVASIAPNSTLDVAQNVTAHVVFSEQVLLTISLATVTGGGTATRSGWVAAGQAADLNADVAQAPAGWTFTGWQGTGPGSYTGPNATETIYPAGPVTETATFVPTSSIAGTGSPTTPMSDWLVIGLIVVAAALIGAIEGRALARRRRSTPRPAVGQPVEGELVEAK